METSSLILARSRPICWRPLTCVVPTTVRWIKTFLCPGNPHTLESYKHTPNMKCLVVWLVWNNMLHLYIWNVSIIQMNLLFTCTGGLTLTPTPTKSCISYQWSKCSSFSTIHKPISTGSKRQYFAMCHECHGQKHVKTWFIWYSHLRDPSGRSLAMDWWPPPQASQASRASQAFCFTAASMLPSEEIKGKQRLNVCRHCQKPGWCPKAPRPQLGQWGSSSHPNRTESNRIEQNRTESWTMLSPEPLSFYKRLVSMADNYLEQWWSKQGRSSGCVAAPRWLSAPASLVSKYFIMVSYAFLRRLWPRADVLIMAMM